MLYSRISQKEADRIRLTTMTTTTARSPQRQTTRPMSVRTITYISQSTYPESNRAKFDSTLEPFLRIERHKANGLDLREFTVDNYSTVTGKMTLFEAVPEVSTLLKRERLTIKQTQCTRILHAICTEAKIVLAEDSVRKKQQREERLLQQRVTK